MKLELYLVPEDKEGILLKNFLEENKLAHRIIIIKEINELRKVIQFPTDEMISLLKITKNHSISIITGYNELLLNQLLEHIKKYKPKIEENF